MTLLKIALVLCFVGSGCAAPQTSPLHAVFSMKLLDALEQQHGGIDATDNLVICPVALENVLDVLLLGAEGNTAKQIQAALAETSASKSPKAKDPNDYVQIANLLALQTQFGFKQSFIEAAQNRFQAQLLTENFQSASHKSTQDINNWLSAQTKSNVSNLFSADLLTNTKLVAANAVHFVGTWSAPIFPDFTQKWPFQLQSGKIVHVDMMQAFAFYNYAAFDDGELLQIPFRDQGLSMLLFLPNASHVASAKSFASLFSEVPIEKRMAALSGIYTYLYLPRLNVKASKAGVSLKEQLQSLGVTDAFDAEHADFSGIDGQKDLHLDNVLQQVSLQVDEQGARADGGVGTNDLGGAGGGILPTPATVNMMFNRTFLYMVHDEADPQNPLTLFTGVVHNPNLK